MANRYSTNYRMNRIFRDDRAALVVPIDHGLVWGRVEALEAPVKVMKRFIDEDITGFMVSTGIVTTVPLLLFAAAARRVTLVTIGLLQFIAPILQFLTGLALGEHMSSARWTGFLIVWIALVVLAADAVRHSVRSRRRPPRAAPAEGTTPAT